MHINQKLTLKSMQTTNRVATQIYRNLQLSFRWLIFSWRFICLIASYWHYNFHTGSITILSAKRRQHRKTVN